MIQCYRNIFEGHYFEYRRVSRKSVREEDTVIRFHIRHYTLLFQQRRLGTEGSP